MQKLILLLVSISAAIYCTAQQVDLARFEKERVSKQKNAMIVLGGWSAANIIVSGIATNTRNKGYLLTIRDKMTNSEISNLNKRKPFIERRIVYFEEIMVISYYIFGMCVCRFISSQPEQGLINPHGIGG